MEKIYKFLPGLPFESIARVLQTVPKGQLAIRLRVAVASGSARDENPGIIHCTDKGWNMKNIKDQGLADAIGEEIVLWYE